MASPQNEALLGSGSKVIGTLTFSGPVQLEGEVEGEVNCKDRLVIGQAAVIKAKVIGTEIIVQGDVVGDITASKSLTLKKPAKVHGNIATEQLCIEEGVIFEGNCSMKVSSKETKQL
ncbi:MAG: polymer-forming cytoskeletal protein [SAR324 cluster bacterium]|uniref:Polymer-forming cytoskeletal protein n=1 Tax=SAR324 cluster bacterium TaxID=2024889 RepID=A0A7X9FV36_9DELT|nr:polymer-forming cytoskeletal protein [SAR324 cluster bacterium]